jgi:hypothetical protein
MYVYLLVGEARRVALLEKKRYFGYFSIVLSSTKYNTSSHPPAGVENNCDEFFVNHSITPITYYYFFD